MDNTLKTAESEWTWMCRACGQAHFHGETHCKRCGRERSPARPLSVAKDAQSKRGE